MPNSNDKVNSLLAKMTLEEKVGQLNLVPNESDAGAELIQSGGLGSLICATSAYAGNEKQNRVRVENINRLQKISKEESRLGIPLLVGRDVIHGHRTVAPIPLGQASSWSPELVHNAARVASQEAYADGVRWVYTPMLDIARDGRWGRIAESYGEDPHLASVLARASIEGLQERKDGVLQIAACAKHFVGYGSVEGGRDYNSGEIGPFSMRNIYMPPFKAAVEAGVASIMTCFNDLGGVPVTADPRLVRDILKNEWGFEGFTVSDWGAVEELITHGVAADKAQAALLALSAGIDVDMASDCYLGNLGALLASGKVSLEWIDDAVRRLLLVKQDLGLFENPYTDESLIEERHFTATNKEKVLDLCRKSIVLIKNSDRILPLTADHKKIGLFGPMMDEQAAMLGTWCLDGLASDVVTLREACSSEFSSREFLFSNHADEAINMARYCDVAIVAVGETAQRTGEANSTTTIDLPPGQLEFIKGVHRIGVPVIAVVYAGRPINLSWLEANVDGILFAWHPGVVGNLAVAEILSGRTRPSGRLPVTFPRSTGQIPIYYNHRRTGRPLDPYERGVSRYVDEKDSPLYPFGFGLGYGSSEYSDLKASRRGDKFKVTCMVSGDIDEVVQLYIRDEVAVAARPVKELKAFQHASLQGRQVVEFDLDESHLGYYGPDEKWRVDPGEFEVFVGSDSVRGISTKFDL
ncbi:MAG TPA: glycoside hydrolase family 3 N-terminal domain-containing protein [Fimbriimonadaceae bacterium]|jgi:beta-glucosidase